ncbi:unnamed protein product [Nezara viridula]|uniref:Uncharacterized protein n=1 Tax=Nezara viridula TaxID=85310 RepID=A0A9P0H9L9_NEZVI|nr:unnamed protein product [Nezara viridula]
MLMVLSLRHNRAYHAAALLSPSNILLTAPRNWARWQAADRCYLPEIGAHLCPYPSNSNYLEQGPRQHLVMELSRSGC